MNLILDTNIILYLLNGDERLREFLRDQTIFLPFIVELELLALENISAKEESGINEFISDCFKIPYSDELKNTVIEIRKKYKLKIPDAFIAAASILFEIPLMSSDKVFRRIDGLDFIEYQI